MTLLLGSIFLGIGLALTVPLFHRLLKNRMGGVLSLYPALIFFQLILLTPDIAGGKTLVENIPWVPSLGLNLTFKLDGLSLLLTLLISGIGSLVILYGSEYLHDHIHLQRFYCLILLFMTAMLGLVLSENALLLFMFWELTSISSFFLIGFEFSKANARAAAWQALLVTGAGGLALLAGFVMLGQITGSYEIRRWAEMAGEINSHPLSPVAFILILIGAMTKSAQFPFHFWLPNAMEAPTPVSAYLHSATMVKAGIYLLARLLPVFGGLAIWTPSLTIIGLITLITSALLALGQTDLKRLLAYTTIAALGMITLLLGIATPIAVKTAMVYLFAHALYKGALFLVAGGVDHATGSRDVRELGRLAKAMPYTAAAAGLAALSMIGFPPLIGFISKELVYESTLTAFNFALPLTGLVLLANVAIAAVAGWVGIGPFWGKSSQEIRPHEGSFQLWMPPLLLAFISLMIGLFAQPVGDWVIGPAAQAILLTQVKAKLSLWHGFTPMLLLSILTVFIGIGIYFLRSRIQPAVNPVWQTIGKFGPSSMYQHGLKGLLSFAAYQTRVLQNGYLRFYVMTIILTTLGLTGLTFFTRVGLFSVNFGSMPRFYDVILVGIILCAAFLVTRARSRLTTIALLGSIGFSVALIFLLYSAPDLAMVQFAIETLTVILFVLVIYRLPKFNQLSNRVTRGIDIIISLAGGVLMTTLMLLISTHGSESRLASYFVQNSEVLANGRNVVNVILVDFRGFDTLGEISVLAIAAIGVYSLIRLNQKIQ